VSKARRALPALTALAALVVAEAALPRLLYRPLDPAARYGRNPHLRRDWDNYIRVTSVPRPPEVRILLLSNSQGNGPEYPDRAIYAWILQDLLNQGRSGPPVRVVNWSFGPNRVPEAIALLARAQDLQPHLTVSVFHGGWFQPADYSFAGRKTPLTMFPGDVVDTVWLYRDRLPPAYREHYLGPVNAMSAAFARTWPTYRFRDLPVSWLQVHEPWFRPFVPEGEWAAWFLAARARRSRLQAQPVAGLLPPPPEPALLEMFGDAASRLPGPRIFVFQPHYYRLQRAVSAHEQVKPELERRGFQVWDLSHAVPWRQFLEGQQIHLADDGHRTMAAALAERLRPLVDGSSPGPE
jgi:hypothetical protein